MAYREYAMVTLPAAGWKLPFNLAVLLHILALSSAIILPKYLSTNNLIPEVYSVDLVSITDPALAPVPPPPTAKPVTPKTKQPVVTIQKLKSVSAKKTAPIAPPVPVAEEPVATPAKVVSLKPLKRKVKNKNAPDIHARQLRAKQDAADQKTKEKQLLEAQRQQHLQEAKRQQALAAAEAQAATNEAVNALKQSLMANAAADIATGSNRPAARSTSKPSSAIASQYHASIFAHLHQYWSLPDIKKWNPELTSVIIITIAKDGAILNHRFEKRSGDRVFDQFVSKTIQDANPLPAIPGPLRKQQYTIGLRFKPGGIL